MPNIVSRREEKQLMNVCRIVERSIEKRSLIYRCFKICIFLKRLKQLNVQHAFFILQNFLCQTNGVIQKISDKLATSKKFLSGKNSVPKDKTSWLSVKSYFLTYKPDISGNEPKIKKQNVD